MASSNNPAVLTRRDSSDFTLDFTLSSTYSSFQTLVYPSTIVLTSDVRRQLLRFARLYEGTLILVYKGCMISKTRVIPYYFQNFDSFYPLIFHPKNASIVNFLTKFSQDYLMSQKSFGRVACTVGHGQTRKHATFPNAF